MFGFGKKRLDDRMMSMIMVEIGMFQSWTLDNRQTYFDPDFAVSVIMRILERENLKYTEMQVMTMRLMFVSDIEFEQYRELRRRYNFDSKIEGFCRSINLSREYYTPS
jgi:hypothetical protein